LQIVVFLPPLFHTLFSAAKVISCAASQTVLVAASPVREAVSFKVLTAFTGALTVFSAVFSACAADFHVIFAAALTVFPAALTAAFTAWSVALLLSGFFLPPSVVCFSFGSSFPHGDSFS